MLIIGLTGSIGTGKTTATSYLASKGLPVWSADEVVHQLYRGKTALLIEEAFPGTLQNGRVDRQLLARHLMNTPGSIERLEAIIHPLVGQARVRFIEDHRAKDTQAILLDIPLLFEKNLQDLVDLSLLIATSPEIRRARVLSRPGMSIEKFDMLGARQMDQQEKRQRADYIIENNGTLDVFHEALDGFVESLQN